MSIVGSARPLKITKGIDGEGWLTYVATYEVIVTDPFEDMDAVTLATGIAGWGESLSFGATVNPDAWCINKFGDYTDQDGTNLKRVVTCTFSTKPGSRARSSGNVITNPMNEPWKVSGSFATGTRVTGIDKDGAPIYTTGLENKFFEVPDGYDTWRVEGPSESMSLSQRSQARVKCNSATIWGLTSRKVFLAQWQVDVLFHGDSSYFYHRLEFWIKDEGWNEVWLNEGTQEYDDSYAVGQRIRPIIGANDSGGKQLRYLDADGIIIPETSLPGSIVTNTSQVIKEFDFTALCSSIGLPDPLPGNFI